MVGMAKVMLLLTVMAATGGVVYGLPSKSVLKHVSRVNALGRHLGIVVPNAYEMSPLLNNSIFQPFSRVPTIDIGGTLPSFST